MSKRHSPDFFFREVFISKYSGVLLSYKQYSLQAGAGRNTNMQSYASFEEAVPSGNQTWPMEIPRSVGPTFPLPSGYD